MNEVVTDLINLVLFTAISTMSTYGAIYFKKLTQRAKLEMEELLSKKEREVYNEAINEANKIVSKIVIAIEEDTGKELKKDIKEGRARKNELDRLLELALDKLACEMKEEYRESLNKNIYKTQDYLTTLIENEVFNLKQS
jgi:hypothetical protein